MNMNKNIKVKNFGPIKQADIDVCPFTVFVGPNSSGKSYLALLVHSLLNPLNNQNLFQDFSMNSLDLLLKNNHGLFKEFGDELLNYIDSKPDFSNDFFVFSKEKFNQLIFDGAGLYYQSVVESRIKNNFSGDLNKLNNIRSADDFDFVFRGIEFKNDGGDLKISRFSEDRNFYDGKFILSVSQSGDNVLMRLNDMMLFETVDKKELLPGFIYSLLSQTLFYNLKENSYYIPASSYRIYYDFNSYLTRQINGSVKPSSLEKELLANLLNNKHPDKSPFSDLADEMSEDILASNLVFSNDVGEEIRLVDDNYGVEFDFSMVSSSVKELSSLIKYLKDELNEGDTLILEEPENHLHPRNQRILVKYLVKAVNLGLNIIMTTHSDYILEQINNFIRLSNVSEDKLNEFEYSSYNILNPNNVKIYNFKRQSDYLYTPCEMEIDETGFVDHNFSEVTDELYNESVDIIESMDGD